MSRTCLAVALVVLSCGAGCWSHYKGVEVRTVEYEKPREVQGVPCGTSAELDPEDRLLSCTLSRDAELGEARLPERTWVRFNADGTIRYCFLPGNTTIQGHLCRGEGHGSMTTFHPSGRLRLCWLAEPETIQGIPCVKATTSGEVFGRLAGRGGPGVVFHESGDLESCKLSEPIEIDGKRYKRGRRITLDEEGNVIEP